MEQFRPKPEPALGDIFMQEIKNKLGVLESNTEGLKTALPTILNKNLEEFGKTNDLVRSTTQTIDGVRLRVDDVTKSLKQLKTNVDKDFKVVSDVLMDFEKQYDMMKDSIVSTKRRTLAMFIFMLCNTILSSFVLIKMSAML